MKNNSAIVFVIPGFGQGGAQKQCILLINQLVSQYPGLNIHLVYFYEGIYWPILLADRITLHKGQAKSMWSLSAIFFLLRVIFNIRPKIVFSWLHSADVFCGLLTSIGFIKKWIMAERDSFYPDEFRYNIRKFLGHKADCIVSNSDAGAQMWANLGVPSSRLVVHENILFNNENNYTSSANYDFLYAGRLEKQKNIDLLLKIISSYSGSRWLLIGNGSYEAGVVELAAKFPDRVKYLPFQKDIFSFYAQAKVFVSLSFHEGTPNTVIENISIGKRVVVSDIKEHVSLLGRDYPFLCSPTGAVDDVVATLNLALKNNNPEHDYVFAKSRLNNMSPAVVAEKYYHLFNLVAKND